MIIPIRCMNCGFLLADKWRTYEKKVAEYRGTLGVTGPVFIDGTSIPVTPEAKALEDLQVKRYCCRKHFLTHRDLIEKI